MQAIAQEGRGLVVYDYQEGRGIGLIAKLQAYELQDAGIDTVEANHALGFKADCRDFSLAAAILHDLNVSRVRLLTNNLRKVHALSAAGVEVVARIPCEVAPTPHSLAYLRTKKEKMGHVLSLRQHESVQQTTDLGAVRSHKLKRRHAGLHGGEHDRTVDVAW
jgi:GTP cyclohydrolase II